VILFHLALDNKVYSVYGNNQNYGLFIASLETEELMTACLCINYIVDY